MAGGGGSVPHRPDLNLISILMGLMVEHVLLLIIDYEYINEMMSFIPLSVRGSV